MLGHVQALLAEGGIAFTRLNETVTIAALDPSDILFVDDLHLLNAERIADVRARAHDPEAALVVATRPWPRTQPLRAALHELEHTLPTVVTGHVIEADVASFLRAAGRTGWERCLPPLIELTGGVTWLISEALSLHGAGPCTDPHHDVLQHTLTERIAQRLDGTDDQLRSGIERAIIAGPSALAEGEPARARMADDLIIHGYSEGLLLRNGSVPPLVRDAVHSAIPVHRLIEAATAGTEDGGSCTATGSVAAPSGIEAVVEHRVTTFLCAQADRFVDSDPARAEDLYRRAVDDNPAARLASLRARAAWAAGDLDATARFLDDATAAASAMDFDLADAAGAVWSARTMMATGSEVYDGVSDLSGARTARAAIVHLGAGRPDRLAAVTDDPPSQQCTYTTLGVALRMLDQGLRATLAQDPAPESVGDLVRASELYTSSRTTDPIAELPAVIAATAAIGMGDLAAARLAVESALAGQQGGDWARRRLLLWRAWVAIHDERPADARVALRQAQSLARPAMPRDELMETAVELVLTRRYDDLASLEALWAHRRDRIRYAQFDLYLLQPLATMVAATARIGDSSTVAPHVSHAQALLERLGSPPLWSAHLQWAGIQQGILLNRPQLLAPYAHALVEASDRSRVAHAMALAGRVWMSVLGGHVDADAVEDSSASLAGVGLAWDGARLAGHGSARTDDRKDALRLLACARRLHPRDAPRQPAEPATQQPATGSADAPTPVLSEREFEVAHLVLQGKTYAEIGKEIFISPRTAEHHIARIRQRLGATNRSDLLAKLRVLIASAPSSHPPTHGGQQVRPQTPIHPPADRGEPPISGSDPPRSVAEEHTAEVTGVLQ